MKGDSLLDALGVLLSYLELNFVINLLNEGLINPKAWWKLVKIQFALMRFKIFVYIFFKKLKNTQKYKGH